MDKYGTYSYVLLPRRLGKSVHHPEDGMALWIASSDPIAFRRVSQLYGCWMLNASARSRSVGNCDGLPE
jgi:hypothetical protein